MASATSATNRGNLASNLVSSLLLFAHEITKSVGPFLNELLFFPTILDSTGKTIYYYAIEEDINSIRLRTSRCQILK